MLKGWITLQADGYRPAPFISLSPQIRQRTSPPELAPFGAPFFCYFPRASCSCCTMAMPAEAPIRVAPASSMAFAVA